MKNTVKLVLCALCVAIPASASAQQKDATGCQDHPLFTRMPGYWIRDCVNTDFDAFAFMTGKGTTERVEGKMARLSYYPLGTLTTKPSQLQILRNLENAAKSLSGSVVAGTADRETLKIARDGKEVWVDVTAGINGVYRLTIMERAEMVQDIVANAALFANDIKSSGHVAVYGILFDVAKSEIKPESEKAIGEIAKLLTADPSLKVYVVGHTDAVGTVESNLKLSQDRAEAVLQALVKSHGIAAARLKAFGNGPFAPVASNDSEEGRAKNRRVELVKQ